MMGSGIRRSGWMFGLFVAVAAMGPVTVGVRSAEAQVSSIGARHRKAVEADPPKPEPREAVKVKRNQLYDRFSWTAVPAKPPRKFKVHDLVTIIVRHRTRYESDADLEKRKEWDIRSELEAFIKLTQGGMGASMFRRGKPTVDYGYENRLRGEGELNREDNVTTRITAEVIDIKPNGNLVIQARNELRFDEDVSTITLTGVCRKDDVTADNTVLSTQVADLAIESVTEGSVRRATKRGILPGILDFLNPI